jgi:RNA ligase
MAFISYPSTPDFAKFKRDLLYDPISSDGSEQADYEGYKPKGIFIGTVKLHGTNVSIIYTMSDRTTPQFQSRNQIITPVKDNMGAAAFLSRAPLRALIDEVMRIYGQEDFAEVLIAGEWAGEGIQKGVALSSLPRFYAIFNIRIDGHWVDLRKYKAVHSPEHRIYNIINFTTYSIEIDFQTDTSAMFAEMEKLTAQVAMRCPVGAELTEDLSALVGALDISGSKKKKPVAVSTGEGIVWTLVPEPPFDTILYNFKTKAEQFLTASKVPKEPNVGRSGELTKAKDFADFALAERRYEQGVEYLQEIGKDPKDMKNVGEFIRWMTTDVIKEEGWRMEEMGTNEQDVKKVVTDRARAWYLEYRKREA